MSQGHWGCSAKRPAGTDGLAELGGVIWVVRGVGQPVNVC